MAETVIVLSFALATALIATAPTVIDRIVRKVRERRQRRLEKQIAEAVVGARERGIPVSDYLAQAERERRRKGARRWDKFKTCRCGGAVVRLAKGLRQKRTRSASRSPGPPQHGPPEEEAGRRRLEAGGGANEGGFQEAAPPTYEEVEMRRRATPRRERRFWDA